MTLLDKAFAKATLMACKGYDASFIAPDIRIDDGHILSEKMKKDLPAVEGNARSVLHYTDLTVWYDARRKVPFFSAYNINGSQKAKRVARAGHFRPDPRIPADIQLSQKGFYDLITDRTEFEIGHMAANNEMAWGNDAQLKAYQTFHFPNSCPQAENLNTGIWRSLETYIITEAASLQNDRKIAVFTGPLLRARDPGYVRQPAFKIPLLFFKVIVFQSDKGLYVTAFVMSHDQKMIADHLLVPQAIIKSKTPTPQSSSPFEDFAYKKVFQVNMSDLKQQTGLNFSWDHVTPVPIPGDRHQIEKIRKIKDSKDAAAQEKPVPKFISSEKALTTKDITQRGVHLNIILP